VGTAVSGLFITLLRALIIIPFGDDSSSHIPIIIYFLIAIGFNTFDMFVNIKFCKSHVYKTKIDHFMLKKDQEKEPEPSSLIGGQGEKSLLEQEGMEETEEPISAEYLKEESRI
jgi:hypothetical protein